MKSIVVGADKLPKRRVTERPWMLQRQARTCCRHTQGSGGGLLNVWQGTTRHVDGAATNVRRRMGTMSQGHRKRIEASKPGNVCDRPSDKVDVQKLARAVL